MAQLIARLALSIGFILPVLDRLGWMGAPGSGAVAWGDWAHFSSYTHQLMPFLSPASANVAAVLATLIESVLAIGLLSGYKTKLMGLGAAIITFIFGLCMFFALGPLAPFNYPVFVFTATGLLLYKQNGFKWSLDQLLQKRSRNS